MSINHNINNKFYILCSILYIMYLIKYHPIHSSNNHTVYYIIDNNLITNNDYDYNEEDNIDEENEEENNEEENIDEENEKENNEEENDKEENIDGDNIDEENEEKDKNEEIYRLEDKINDILKCYLMNLIYSYMFITFLIMFFIFNMFFNENKQQNN